MLWLLVLLVTITWVLQRRWAMRRQAALAKQLKTKIRAYPFVGHIYKFIGSNEERMKICEAFGRDAIAAGGVSKYMHFDQLFVYVADPVVAEIVLSQYLEKHDIMKIMDLVVGDASLIAPVHIWRHRRKIDAPIFNTKNLIQFVDTFSEHSIEMADLLDKEVDKGTFSFLEYVAVCNLNAVCETTMGVKTNLRGSKFFIAIEELWQIAVHFIAFQPLLIKSKFMFRFIPTYYRTLEHKRTVYDFLTKIIRDKKAIINEKSEQKDFKMTKDKVSSFLDLQLETSECTRKLTEQELYEESLMLVVAGYDTTASTAGFVVVMLSRHPKIQDKVYEELKEVFGDSDRPVTYEDLQRLKYLDAVIKETMRLYPIVPVIVRQADKDVQLPSGLTIVKGCGVFVNIWAVHRNPEYWGEDADQFRPERFLNFTPKHPAAFMPFSYGPRGCVGMRYGMLLLKTELSTLLRRYKVLPPPGVKRGEPLRTKYEMMMRHVDNIQIRLEHRKQIN